MKARYFAASQAVLLVLLVLVTLLSAGCGESAPERPDSVLLVTLDTLRADYVSAYNPESPVNTARFDALAAEGALVTKAWSTVPLTTPAHASIFTGLYPPGHGVRNNARFRLPEDVTTLAEVLRNEGRQTAAFTAAFTTSTLFGLGQGFDVYDDDLGHSETGSARSSRPGDEVLLNVLRWFNERGDSRQPFFLWVHFFDPHTPYNAPVEFSRQYPQDAYAGEVAFTDFLLGTLLDELDKRGLAERTIVMALADHGEGLGTHGEPEHGLLLYEEVLHVPFALRAPGLVEPGTRVDEPSSIVDVTPTLLSLLDIELPGPMHGRDIFGATPAGPPYAETLYPHEEFGWSALYSRREGDEKLIVSSENELYDLAADPREGQDLSSERPERVSSMRELLEEQVAGLIDEGRLAAAAGFGGAEDPETIARLESLGYVAGGGGAGGDEGGDDAPALGATSGRNPRHAMDDYQLFKRAQEFQAKGELDTARKFFERLVQNDPDNPQFGLKLAGVLDKLDDAEAAEAAYRDLIERNPTFYLATQSFSSFLERRGRPLESRQLWMRLASEVPGYVGVETRIARAEIAAGVFDAAAQRMERFLEERPDSSRGWALLGQALEGQGKPEESVEAFLRSLNLRPTETRALEGVVRVLEDRGETQRARQVLNTMLERAPRDPMITKLLESLEE